MIKFDPDIDTNLESKLVAVNKADMKLHLAKIELRDSICDALCSVLSKDAEIDEILDAVRSVNICRRMNKQEKGMIAKIVYERLNGIV